jgi:aminoglycoside phosphotransferase (APT) family kinase protein
VARRYTPQLAARFEPAVLSLESSASESIADGEVTAHGDFSYSQLLFSGGRRGIVDFDGVCRAEPALDLGHFLAYLRFAVVKAAGVDDAARFAPLTGELEARFLDTYRSASGPGAGVADERIGLYEKASLARLALHAWQKMKPQRLGWLLAALDGQTTTVR